MWWKLALGVYGVGAFVTYSRLQKTQEQHPFLGALVWPIKLAAPNLSLTPGG